MNGQINLPTNRTRGGQRTRDFNWRYWGVGFGLCGLISPVLGAALTAIALVRGPTWHGLSIQRYGTLLFFLTIPLLVIGAWCLDLLEERKKKVGCDRIN